jgi:hypothetical protein
MAKVELVLPVLAALLLVSAARWWIFGADRGTLAFASAEVQFLFPAPVSRRALIHTKLVRTQIAILLNTVIFTCSCAAERVRPPSGVGDRAWIGFGALTASARRVDRAERPRA